MNTNRIGFFPGELTLGGIGRLTLNLAEQFLKWDYEVDLFLTRQKGPYMDMVPESITVFTGRGRTLSSFSAYRAYLTSRRPFAVISSRDHLNITNIIGCQLAGGQTKSVISVHTNQSAEGKSNLKSGIERQISKRVYPKASHIVAVSKGVAADMSKRLALPETMIQTIHNPTYIPSRYNTNPEPDHPWLKDPGQEVILGVGRLTRQKNFSLLIEAFHKLRQKRQARLVILGDGEEREMLQNKVNELNITDSVDLPGYIADPIPYFQKADLYVMSSLWEGFGNTIVEALGAGTPVVSTDCESGPAEILCQGEYGLMVPVSDADNLSDAMLQTLASPPSSQKLIKRAEAFSVENIARQYLSMIYS